MFCKDKRYRNSHHTRSVTRFHTRSRWWLSPLRLKPTNCIGENQNQGLLRNRSKLWQKTFWRKMLFSFIRFVLLMFGWTKNRYFTSNLWIGNPLGTFQDIKILAKSVWRTHLTKFSDSINSALRTYSQSSNYDEQSVKPSSYHSQKWTQ